MPHCSAVLIHFFVPSDIEENGVRLRLTVVDTPGFGDFVNNDERYLIVLLRKPQYLIWLLSIL